MASRARSRDVLPVLIGCVYVLGASVLVYSTFATTKHVDLGRLLFWIALTLAASLAPVSLPGGLVAYPNTAPLIAAAFDTELANPFGIVWIALLGTFSLRDVRRQLPWYGTIYNRLDFVLSIFCAWGAIQITGAAVRPGDPLGIVAQIVICGAVFSFVNNLVAVSAAAARTHVPIARVWTMSSRNVALGLFAQVPLGWLMAEVALKVGIWATVLFAVPLLLARYTFSKFVELRDLFFGTVSALSQAIDAKDGYTRGHADRVSRIAGAIARELGVSEGDIEHIELAGMLHDIGKIGVEDRILLKPARLDDGETQAMQRHPIFGAAILEPSKQLRPLVPIVLHHHEHFNGSGYPEGLVGEEIPMGSRILLVADAYEAMTSDRIYRKAIGHEGALQQLNKYQGIQFDPKVVRAFERILVKHGVAAFEASELPPITYETLAEVRKRLTREPKAREPSHAG
jgi:putative nucleotidyltransferase with HDIG domain